MIENQHGFLKNRSTTSNLALYIDNLSELVDHNQQVDCIYTDLAKAFDVVDHHILLQKLENYYGFTGNVLKFIKSYLQNREMNVVIGGYISDAFLSTSGVPQGSHLGPILFGIFINDVAKCFKYSKFHLYADDLKMYKKIENVNDSRILQQDLDRFTDWCEENHLKLNPFKCHSVIFSRKVANVNFQYRIASHAIEQVNQIKDLGIIVDSKLSFIPHVDNLVKQSFKMTGFIIRCTRDFKKSATKLSLFNSLVRSKLEYCSVAWNPYYEVHKLKLERVQKKFFRHLDYMDDAQSSEENYKEQLIYYKNMSLTNRRKLLDLCFLQKVLKGSIDCPELTNKVKLYISRPNTRYHKQSKPIFRTKIAKTKLGVTAPINRAISSYNSIHKDTHIDIFGDSEKQFKNNIKKILRML